MADQESVVRMIATGGTIASHLIDGSWTSLPGAQLVEELGPLPVRVDVVDVATGSSSNLSVDDMMIICHRVADAIGSGARGVVVTHGTDTLELTSFLCSLTVETAGKSVVFTGAMRPHSADNIDGPQNLRDAISLASRNDTGDLGVVVALGGTVHTPAWVRKVNAVEVDAFSSYPFAPRGRLVDGRLVSEDGMVRVVAPALSLPALARELEQNVPLVVAYPGMHESLLHEACRGARGVVLEAFGELNSPENLWPVVRRAVDDGVLVAITSHSFTPTLRNDSLNILGARGMGGLTSQKARLALMCALGDGRTRDEANDFIDSLLGETK